MCADASLSPLCADGSEPGRVRDPVKLFGGFLFYLSLFFFIFIQNLRVVAVVEEAEANLSINFDFFYFLEQKCAVLQYPPYQLA